MVKATYHVELDTLEGGMMTALKKLHPNEKIIIQITDTHLMDCPHSTFVKMNPEQSFHAVIEDIKSKYADIDAIIHTGDLAQVPKPETYQRYHTFMQSFGVPFYQIPGNHDDASIFPFLTPEPVPGVLSFGNWRIVLLNSAVPKKVDGWIQREQLHHLKLILEQTASNNVILACHHHPLDMESNWIDQHKLKNTCELTEILAQFEQIRAVICGHVHQDSLNIWNHIQFLSSPSTSVQFKPKSYDFAFDTVSPGYRCLLLKENGTFETRVHRLAEFTQHINHDISGY